MGTGVFPFASLVATGGLVSSRYIYVQIVLPRSQAPLKSDVHPSLFSTRTSLKKSRALRSVDVFVKSLLHRSTVPRMLMGTFRSAVRSSRGVSKTPAGGLPTFRVQRNSAMDAAAVARNSGCSPPQNGQGSLSLSIICLEYHHLDPLTTLP